MVFSWRPPFGVAAGLGAKVIMRATEKVGRFDDESR
jgi:hypothetical protein